MVFSHGFWHVGRPAAHLLLGRIFSTEQTALQHFTLPWQQLTKYFPYKWEGRTCGFLKDHRLCWPFKWPIAVFPQTCAMCDPEPRKSHSFRCYRPWDLGRPGHQMSWGDTSGVDLQVRPTRVLSCPLSAPVETWVLFANWNDAVAASYTCFPALCKLGYYFHTQCKLCSFKDLI